MVVDRVARTQARLRGLPGGTMLTRRCMLRLGVTALAMAYGQRTLNANVTADEKFEVTRTDAEWRKLITPAQYSVLRHAATEPAFSSPLDREKRRGTFAC